MDHRVRLLRWSAPSRWQADAMDAHQDKTERFLALHQGPGALLLPNPWDAGTAKLLASLGFSALATTSSGFAATLGRNDGSVSRDEAIGHAALIVAATELPVSADLENGYADEPERVAETIELALAVGLAGCSIEDYTRRPDDPIYELGRATALEAGDRLVLTARAENYLHGRPDLSETIARL